MIDAGPKSQEADYVGTDPSRAAIVGVVDSMAARLKMGLNRLDGNMADMQKCSRMD